MTDYIDNRGLTMLVGSLKVGANDSNDAGTDIEAADYLTGNTAGTVTAGKIVVVDADKDISSFRNVGIAGDLTVAAGGSVKTSVSNTLYPVFLNQVQQAINANGAITITQYNTALTSVTTTGQAFTLADSTIKGQVKKIVLVADGADATVTFNTNATLVFADVGDTAELIWNGSDWIPIALYNCASGDVGPAYTPAS